MTERPNIHQQIEELQRELSLRGTVYPGWVARGKLRQSEADEHMARLRAALDTLLWCRDHRDTVLAVEKASHPVVQMGAGGELAEPRVPVVLSISVPPGAAISPETRAALIRMAEAAAEQLKALPEGGE